MPIFYKILPMVIYKV